MVSKYIPAVTKDNGYAQPTKIAKLSAPAASYNFVSSSDLECVYQPTGRCGRVANPYRSPQERGLLAGPVPSAKPCHRNPFPMTDRKSGVLGGCTMERRGRGVSNTRVVGSYGPMDIVRSRMNLLDKGKDFGKHAKG